MHTLVWLVVNLTYLFRKSHSHPTNQQQTNSLCIWTAVPLLQVLRTNDQEVLPPNSHKNSNSIYTPTQYLLHTKVKKKDYHARDKHTYTYYWSYSTYAVREERLYFRVAPWNMPQEAWVVLGTVTTITKRENKKCFTLIFVYISVFEGGDVEKNREISGRPHPIYNPHTPI